MHGGLAVHVADVVLDGPAAQREALGDLLTREPCHEQPDRGWREAPPSFEEFATGELEDYFSPMFNQRMETCLLFGDAADYWIWRGLAREITMEDALRYLQRSVDDGFIIQSLFDTESLRPGGRPR